MVKKAANLFGFAAPVLLRPTLERLLDSYLRARLEPSPEQRKAQEQDQAKQQRELGGHVRAINLRKCLSVSRARYT